MKLLKLNPRGWRHADAAMRKKAQTKETHMRYKNILIGLLVALVASLSAQAAPPPASAPAQAKPVWPNNGIAQRRIGAVGPGGAGVGVMFVEDDHGTLRAWVVSDYIKLLDNEHATANALDFFSGKVMPVKVDLTEDGHEDQAFTDAHGGYHFYAANPNFRFTGTAAGIALPGITFDGDNRDPDLTGSVSQCNVYLKSTSPVGDILAGTPPPVMWHKFPIYHYLPMSGGCSSGILHSAIEGALDLDDGTFLAAEGCFVFRLRKSDLSPVGAAPALTVVDAKTLDAVIAKAKGQPIQDAAGYLIKALHLPTSVNVSCKED